MSELGKECTHGSLMRQCYICDLESDAANCSVLIWKARAEALEEAAGLVQNFKWSTDDDSDVTELLAHKIRALIKP